MAHTSADDVPVDLTGRVRIMADEKRPFAQGGLADIWLGILASESLNLPSIGSSGSDTVVAPVKKIVSSGRKAGRTGDELSATDKKVAIKALRCATETTQATITAMINRLDREVRVWKRLSHPNVLPMYGTCNPAELGKAFDPQFKLLISPYCKNRNVQAYLTSHPNGANRKHLLRGILKGLAYLHSNNCIHGDIKPVNVLIDDSGHAQLSDFGLSRIVDETGFTTKNPGATIRYWAPELYPPPPADEDEEAVSERPLPKITPATDIWAFGMTALQILSKDFHYPFRNIESVAVVMQIVLGKRHPSRKVYSEIAGDDWNILLSCWAHEPTGRRRIQNLINDLA